MEELLNPKGDSIRRFLERWYGVADSGENTASSRAQEIPHEIVNWHEAAASAGAKATFQDHPIALANLERSDDGMIIFWVENQNGYYWAIDPVREEREVFCREDASSVWRNTGEKLDLFLLHCTVREAIIGAESKFSAVVPTSALQGCLVGFSPLPFRPLENENPSTRLLCSSDALARVSPPPVGYSHGGEESWLLSIAATSESNVRKYRTSLECYIPPGAGRPHPAEVSIEDIPF
ncbi:hypothetical protein ACEZCY_26160 [Streptacidiphilus sp. N1-12]|uniref:Uncharacterized protein n=2 Tax=Streptacidiphilus alkalitolerans TaxID=3342712 RepID=A0ABV6WKW2_9ACTN